jgi:hypothetical protein
MTIIIYLSGINDYFPIASNLTFEPLQSTGNVSIQIIDDGIAEPNEQFLVMLQSYDNAVQLSAENSILKVSIEAHNQTGKWLCFETLCHLSHNNYYYSCECTSL